MLKNIVFEECIICGLYVFLCFYYSYYINILWLCFKEKNLSVYLTIYLLHKNQNMEDNNKYDKYINLLEANKNLILTGAPGTGKTYLAKAIAGAMNAEFEFVQFHPSYDYADFVEGLRPTPPDNNGNIGFKRVDGVFKSFCKRAISKKNHIKSSSDKKYNDFAKSFDEAYNKLLIAIKQNSITLYSDFRNSKTVLKVKIKDNNLIQFCKTEKYQNAQIEYLRKIYDFYVSKRQYDIRQEKQWQFENIIGNTLDYSYYRGIVQGLLDFTDKQTDREDYNNDIDIKPDTKKIVNIQPSTFIFIIDEINRGEISKIFGELFFSIDPGYRGIKGRVKTQYQNMITDEADIFYEGFYVPENVYIIGTMNDIDRSVESMDFAMRRRFAWEEIKADENTGMLDELQEMKDEVLEVMKRLNAAIWNDDTHSGVEGLNASYHIGGSYFSKLQLYLNEDHTNKKSAYKHLWENHLKGVLFEYLRGTFNAMENLKMLEQVYYNKNNNDDFEG